MQPKLPILLLLTLQSRHDGFPQGYGFAALLGPTIRYTAQVPAPGHASLAAALCATRGGPPDLAAVSIASLDFLCRLGVPTRLQGLDIPQADLPALAGEALQSYYARAAPRPLVDAGEALALLEQAW